MRYQVTTTLTPREALEQALADFGPGGLGLQITSQTNLSLGFQGGGGYIAVTAQQFPESDKTQSSPGYPDCLFVNLHVTISLSRKSFASCTWGLLCRWLLPKAANISPPMRSFAWFETALPASWMIARKLRGLL